jgi:DNA-directed RNA polymerase specialized sigma24 family protein
LRADVPIDEADEVMAHDDHEAAESSYDIGRLMERLSKNMRCAVEAVKLDGLSTAEAARKCGLSESGVKVNVHRGLRTLAALIARKNAP